MNKVSRLLNCTLAMLVVLGLVGANRAMADDASDKAAAIKAKAAAKAAAINEYLAKHAGFATVLSSNSATLPTGGTWTPLTNLPPEAISLSLLLSDGTVMCQPPNNNGSPNWYRLTPDATGSYINGTWTMLASMHYGRNFYQSQVIRDGRVFVSGAETGSPMAPGPRRSPMTQPPISGPCYRLSLR